MSSGARACGWHGRFAPVPSTSPALNDTVLIDDRIDLGKAQFWDGRAADLADQARGSVQAGVEMANTLDNVVATLNSMPQCVEWFDAWLNGDEGAAARQTR